VIFDKIGGFVNGLASLATRSLNPVLVAVKSVVVPLAGNVLAAR
jgi:hypothetical protein